MENLVNHHGVKPIIVDFLYNKQNLFRQTRFCCYFWSYSCIVVLYFLTNSDRSDQAVYSRSFFLFCSFAICYSLVLSSHTKVLVPIHSHSRQRQAANARAVMISSLRNFGCQCVVPQTHPCTVEFWTTCIDASLPPTSVKSCFYR